jgi:hypothetical protein
MIGVEKAARLAAHIRAVVLLYGGQFPARKRSFSYFIESKKEIHTGSPGFDFQ